MTSGLVNGAYTAPILVLGLGNTLLGDDGFGPTLLEKLAERYPYAGGFIEFLDGGTQGLNLLDALATGAKPGTVSVLEGSEVVRFATSRSTTAHEGNAGELLATAAFLGDLPEQCFVVGVQPAELETGIGLSRDVQGSLQAALSQAQNVVDQLLVELAEPVQA